MPAAKMPQNESARLAALADYSILDTAAEKIFDSITLLASQICDVQISLIVFIDKDRQWFKSTYGVMEELKDLRETNRDIAFCSHTILGNDLLEVQDLTQDSRFADNPLVNNFPNISYYAGIPLRTSDDLNIGSLCILDQVPKLLTDLQKDALKNLSTIVMSLLEAKKNVSEITVLAQIVKNSFNEVYLFDASSLTCVYTNEEANNHTKIQNQSLLGSHFFEFFLQPNKVEFELLLQPLLQKEKKFIVIESFKKSLDGTEYSVELRIQFSEAKNSSLLIVIANDITERKNAELAKHALQEQKFKHVKEVSDKSNQAKSDFLASMSHEIRTPLNGVISMIDLMMDTSLTEEQHEYAKIISLSSDILLSVINNILDFSKIEAGQVTLETIDFDLQELVDNTIEMFAVKAHSKHLNIAGHLAVDVPPFLKGDVLNIQKIMNNFVSNAIKFTTQGDISLEVKLQEETSNEVLLLVEVRDMGVGISPNGIERLFKSFSQADDSVGRVYGGTGLGLAIAKRLANLMGGDVGVSSQVGEGSLFWFTMRLQKNIVVNSKLTFPIYLQNSEILYIDHSHLNQKIVKQYVESWGMRCIVMEDTHKAFQALLVAAENNKPYALMLINPTTSDTDSFILAEKTLSTPSLSRTPIVIMTNLGANPLAKNFESLGITFKLSKPIRPSKLHEIILNVLNID